MGKIFKIIAILILFVCIAEETPARSDISQQSIDDSGVITRYEYEHTPPLDDNANISTEDPYLESGFPVQTLHTAGTFCWVDMNTRVGNIDADPELEIVVSGYAQGPLYAFNHDGSTVPGWPVTYYNRAFYTSLGNLSSDDPALEILTGQYIYKVPETPPAPILLLSGLGQLLPGWPKENSEVDFCRNAVLADLNSDALDEIIVFDPIDYLSAYDASGVIIPGWPIEGSSAYSISDLDGDGDLEIVTYVNYSSTEVDLVAYHHDGSKVEDFSLHFIPEGHLNPVIGDVDGDRSPEIVFFARDDDGDLKLFIISSTGEIKHQLPLACLEDHCYGAPSREPALADLDGDNVPEIVVGHSAGIFVYGGDGTLFPGFPVGWGPSLSFDGTLTAPVVGDIDGDQQPDIVVVTYNLNALTGQVYVYNNKGQLDSHFPKNLAIDTGIVPAIADLDLDGRNELIITGDYWDGHVGYKDKVWVYDLGGENHGKVEWGQRGGGPQAWGAYPTPPIYAGSNTYLGVPEYLGIPLAETFYFPIQYGNKGVAFTSSLVMTATLDSKLTYIDDTTGITPTVVDQKVTWGLPDIGYLINKNFLLEIQLPLDADYGDTYSISFEITSESLEAVPLDNKKHTAVMVARQVFLPIVER